MVSMVGVAQVVALFSIIQNLRLDLVLSQTSLSLLMATTENQHNFKELLKNALRQ